VFGSSDGDVSKWLEEMDHLPKRSLAGPVNKCLLLEKKLFKDSLQ